MWYFLLYYIELMVFSEDLNYNIISLGESIVDTLD